MTRDEAVLLARLERLGAAVAALTAHAADLHGLAYERPGQGLEPVVAGGGPTGVESVGDPRARALWTELVREVAAADKRLGAVKARALNLLSEGPATPAPSRGSTLHPDEFAAVLARQAARGDAPARLVPQPEYPGTPPPGKKRKKGKR